MLDSPLNGLQNTVSKIAAKVAMETEKHIFEAIIAFYKKMAPALEPKSSGELVELMEQEVVRFRIELYDPAKYTFNLGLESRIYSIKDVRLTNAYTPFIVYSMPDFQWSESKDSRYFKMETRIGYIPLFS